MSEDKTETFLEELSVECLQAEIDKRKEEERKASIPKPLQVLDTKPLQAICQKYVNEISKKHYADGFEHRIYKIALETVFDKGVWRYINSDNTSI